MVCIERKAYIPSFPLSLTFCKKIDDVHLPSLFISMHPGPVITVKSTWGGPNVLTTPSWTRKSIEQDALGSIKSYAEPISSERLSWFCHDTYRSQNNAIEHWFIHRNPPTLLQAIISVYSYHVKNTERIHILRSFSLRETTGTRKNNF